MNRPKYSEEAERALEDEGLVVVFEQVFNAPTAYDEFLQHKTDDLAVREEYLDVRETRLTAWYDLLNGYAWALMATVLALGAGVMWSGFWR